MFLFFDLLGLIIIAFGVEEFIGDLPNNIQMPIVFLIIVFFTFFLIKASLFLNKIFGLTELMILLINLILFLSAVYNTFDWHK